MHPERAWDITPVRCIGEVKVAAHFLNGRT
jgi:hypothetical protein